jgi:protein-disulfide isomerase
MRLKSLLIPLVILTLVMQVAILYKQYQNGVRDQPRVDPVHDAPQNTVIDLRDSPAKGAAAAKIVLVEFSDYECPYCQRHADSVGPKLDRAFINNGLVRLVFVNNPLPIHKNAKMLASAAICAGMQNRFWDMHDSLFRVKPGDKEAILEIAKMLILDEPRFKDCMEDRREAEATIQHDVEIAKGLDLSVTPAFGVGLSDGSGHVQIRKVIKGALPFAVFEKTIRDVLSQQAKS